MRIHIDGDILKYRCGFAAEKGEYILTYVNRYGDEVQEAYNYKKDVKARLEHLGKPDHVLEYARRPEPVENALYNVKNTIKGIKDKVQSDEIVVYLSGPTNFRESIATIREYKGNRNPDHKPIHGPAITDYLRSRYECVVSDNEEADDVIGYSHYAMWEQDPDSSVIATTDKDLDMIPGFHYNFVKEDLYLVSTDFADYRFYFQLLTGDTVDNIQGVEGIGPVKAKALLEPLMESPLDMYQVVREKYDNDEALLENARLLWIRRRPGEIWEPPVAIHYEKTTMGDAT